MNLPPIPGMAIIHSHDEGFPCDDDCTYQSTVFQTLKAIVLEFKQEMLMFAFVVFCIGIIVGVEIKADV